LILDEEIEIIDSVAGWDECEISVRKRGTVFAGK